MKILFALITIITFFLFFIEAFIHFNIGKKSDSYKITKKHNFINISNLFSVHIPDKSEFIQIFVTLTHYPFFCFETTVPKLKLQVS